LRSSKSATLPAKINLWKSQCPILYVRTVTKTNMTGINFQHILWLVCRHVVWTYLQGLNIKTELFLLTPSLKATVRPYPAACAGYTHTCLILNLERIARRHPIRTSECVSGCVHATACLYNTGEGRQEGLFAPQNYCNFFNI
jgi:hypothetical protein